MLGYKGLEELIQNHPQRPEAYFALWNQEYSVQKNYQKALMIAESLFLYAIDYNSFQEK